MADSLGKRAWRTEMRARRDDFVSHLSPGERSLAFSVPPSPLSSLMSAGKIVAGYIAIGSEASPTKLLQTAQERGCSLALPHVVSRSAPMRFLHWSYGEPLELGPFGLMQPNAEAEECMPDVVLVPLLAFDDELIRLGQGAGHYDRALSLLGDAITVGVAWSIQQVDRLPNDPWDIPLDAALTERAWIVR